MAISLLVNGATRQLQALDDGSTLEAVVTQLDLKADRVAIEHNGEIAPKRLWSQLTIHSGDRLEIVHFVGGGSEARRKC